MAKGFQGFLEGFASGGAEIIKEQDKQQQAAQLFIAEHMAASQIDSQMKRLQETADTQIQQGNFNAGLGDFNAPPSTAPTIVQSAPIATPPINPQASPTSTTPTQQGPYGNKITANSPSLDSAAPNLAASVATPTTPATTSPTQINSLDDVLAAKQSTLTPNAMAATAPTGESTINVNGVNITQGDYTAAFAKLTSDERRQPNAAALAKQNAAETKIKTAKEVESATDTHAKTMADLGKDINGNSLSSPEAGTQAIQANAQTMGVKFDPELISPQGQKLAGVLNGADAGSLAYQRAQKAVDTAKKDTFTPAREIAKAQAQTLVSNGLQALEDKANKANTGPVAGSDLGQAIHQFATSNLGTDAQGIKELEAQANANLAFIPRPTNMPRSNTTIALLRGEQPDAKSTPQQNINKVRSMANEIYSLNALYSLQDTAYQTYVLPNKAALNQKFMEYARQNQKYVMDKNGNLIPNMGYMTMDEWLSANRDQIAQQKLQQGMQNNRSAVTGSSVQPSAIIPGVSY